MRKFNNHYTHEEFMNEFPTNENVSFLVDRHKDYCPKLLVIKQKYERIWNYSNRILMRIIDVNPDTLEPTMLLVTFLTELEKNIPVGYQFITTGTDYQKIAEDSMSIWRPEPKLPKVSRLDMALEHIQNNVMSLVKKNKTENASSSDFAFIYYGGTRWHAFCPPIEQLVEFHTRTSGEKFNQAYIDFLLSEELQNKKKVWDESGIIVPGE